MTSPWVVVKGLQIEVAYIIHLKIRKVKGDEYSFFGLKRV
jgi:hypothetical protein